MCHDEYVLLAPNTGIILCHHVAKQGAAATYVCCEDGEHPGEVDYQVLCGEVHAGSKGVLWCWSDVVALDPSLHVVEDLIVDQQAQRAGPGQPWVIEHITEEAA